MRKDELNQYIGKNIRVVLHDGEIAEGILGYTPVFSAKYDFRKPGFYTIQNYDFKVSHIKGVVTI